MKGRGEDYVPRASSFPLSRLGAGDSWCKTNGELWENRNNDPQGAVMPNVVQSRGGARPARLRDVTGP